MKLISSPILNSEFLFPFWRILCYLFLVVLGNFPRLKMWNLSEALRQEEVPLHSPCSELGGIYRSVGFPSGAIETALITNPPSVSSNHQHKQVGPQTTCPVSIWCNLGVLVPSQVLPRPSGREAALIAFYQQKGEHPSPVFWRLSLPKHLYSCWLD